MLTRRDRINGGCVSAAAEDHLAACRCPWLRYRLTHTELQNADPKRMFSNNAAQQEPCKRLAFDFGALLLYRTHKVA